jgi:glycosyltransferase involved in cell wall biosynthesis
MTPTDVVIEGWRKGTHSYALVNQNQLLHLMRDPRLRVSHVDIPFCHPHWGQLDSGFAAADKTSLALLPMPREQHAHAIYRISWPLRIHSGAADRIFVFGTCEFQRFAEGSFCGLDGTQQSVDQNAVEIVTPSAWSRKGFLEAGFEPQRVHVVPHGADPARFKRLNAQERKARRADLEIAEDALVFLNVGAMTWNKGIAPLLAAFADHHRRHPKSVLILKGADALYGNLMHEVFPEAVKLNPTVNDPATLAALRYVPINLPQADLAALFGLADAYVSPYRAEGFNLPVLEALASGIPAIVTAGGSTDDFCPESLCLRVKATPSVGQVGNYLEPDINSLVQCMDRITEERELRAKVALDGPRWVTDHYSWSKVSARLGDLITSRP